jgi:hypothetical protein
VGALKNARNKRTCRGVPALGVPTAAGSALMDTYKCEFHCRMRDTERLPRERYYGAWGESTVNEGTLDPLTV